jgi:hypothetical protein
MIEKSILFCQSRRLERLTAARPRGQLDGVVFVLYFSIFFLCVYAADPLGEPAAMSSRTRAKTISFAHAHESAVYG